MTRLRDYPLGIKVNSDVNQIALEGSEFPISCTVTGAVKPVFRITKDGLNRINRSIASRFVKKLFPPDGNDTNAILIITQANKWDDGKFVCNVIYITQLSAPNIHADIVSPANKCLHVRPYSCLGL